MNNRYRVLAAGAAAAVLTLAGCITPSVPTPTPTPVVTSPATPTPSPTPSLSAAQQDAARAVLRFYEVVDQIATNDEVDLNSVYDVAGGEAAQTWLRDLQAMKVARLTQVGFAIPDIREVGGESEPFTVVTCVDTSQADIVDEQGQSVVGEGNPTRILYHYTVESVGSTLKVTSGEAVSTGC